MKTYLITGAGRGIGLELATQLATRGDTVIAAARKPEGSAALKALAAKFPDRLKTASLDVQSDASAGALAKELAGTPIDVLINNAGIGYWRGLTDSTSDDLLEQFNTNAAGPFRVTRALLPSLRLGKAKQVFSVTSLMGSIGDNGSGGAYGYRASKTALNMINKSLSNDLRADGVTLVVMHPGWVKTDMGGAGAPVEIPKSAAGLIAVMDRTTVKDSGKFFSFEGKELPW